MAATAALPRIIYGTAWKKHNTTALVVQAVLQGFRAIDTACQPKHYREDLVGQALQILKNEHGIQREAIFLQTKFTSIDGQDRSKPLPYDPQTPVREQVLTSFQTSLRNLQTTYLDSYILHSPLPTIEETLQAWEVLMSLQDEGKVRMIGISNTYSVSVLEALARARAVQVVQNRWYERNDWDKEVCAYCRQRGVMYQSFWTLSGSPRLLASPPLLALAEKHGCTPAQVLFRIAQINRVVPLAGSKNETRMHDGVDTEHLNLDEGTDHDLERLSDIIFK